MWDASWVIIERETGKVIFETFDFELCQFINIEKYRVVPIMVHLQNQNKRAGDSLF